MRHGLSSFGWTRSGHFHPGPGQRLSGGLLFGSIAPLRADRCWDWGAVAAKVEIFAGELRLGAVPLHKGQLIVGRRRGLDIQLLDPSVSPVHAAFRYSVAGWTVADLNSSTGTWIGGNRQVMTLLFPGDLISVGEFRIRFLEIPGHNALEGVGPAVFTPPVSGPLLSRSG